MIARVMRRKVPVTKLLPVRVPPWGQNLVGGGSWRKCKNGQARARPFATKISFCACRQLLRRRRQRNRIVRKRPQISDHVGTLGILWNAGKAHRGARHEALGIGEELVEVVVGPGSAHALQGRREIETTATLAALVTDDPVEIWTNLVRAAFGEIVAGTAFLGRCGALVD